MPLSRQSPSWRPNPWPSSSTKTFSLPLLRPFTSWAARSLFLLAMLGPWLVTGPMLAAGRPFPFGTTDDEDLPMGRGGRGGGGGIAGFLDGEDCGSSGCGPQYDEYDDQYVDPDDGMLPGLLAESCKLDGCWQLYQTAQTSLGLGDGFSASSRDDSTPSPQALRDRCIALRTYRRCIDNMTRCKGNLNYHTSHQVVQAKMRQFNCTISGPVFDGAAAPPGRGGPGGYRGGRGQARPQVCSYSGRKEHKHCGLFGDPHLRTFDDKFQTCKVQGAWPLLDNEYLTVQVTNDPVGVWEGTATATSKLTVVVKRNDECAADRFVTYQAQTDLLPAVFDDGRAEFGPEGAVRITEVEPGRHVQIYLRYIDTTLIIRQIGRFFTFAAKMPAEVISERRPSSYPSAASGELCVRGCPHGERINYKKFLARKHKRLKSGSKNVLQEQTTSDATMMMNRDLAETLCRKAQVVDFYFDSCVFDLMTTGDMNFTVAASQALRDVLRLMPQTARMHKNRTDLLEIDAEYTSSATSLRTQGAHRTETYSRICERSLLLSLWTYTICLTLSQWASGTTTTV